MIRRLDAHLPPSIVPWLSSTFGVAATALRDVGLRDADDDAIFAAAGAAGAVVVSKDQDFCELVLRHGPPPQVVWITVGNCSAARLREILVRTLPDSMTLLRRGAPLVEISERHRA